jgi:hypothetical protein
MICPVCGNPSEDGSDEESKEPCKDCKRKCNHIIRIECLVDCGPRGISKHDGVIILDEIVKMILGRGLQPLDVSFYEPYMWREIRFEKEELEKIQQMKAR